MNMEEETKEICDNCKNENGKIRMKCSFCNEKLCASCASLHRDFCLAKDDWEFV